MGKYNTLFFFYKILVFKNITASKYPEIKNDIVILLVATVPSEQTWLKLED